MKNMCKNLIYSTLICLLLINVLLSNGVHTPAKVNSVSKTASATKVEKNKIETETKDDDETKDVDVIPTNVPIVGASLEYSEAAESKKPEPNDAPEMDKCEYQTKYGIIKEEEVGYYDHGDIACASLTVDPYPGYFTMYMDLACRNNISIKQMNKIIDHWLCGRDSKLKNQGEAFIKASQETGLDPVFLLSLAAQEAGWTVSDLHASKNNPYSINMVDSNPSQGYQLGNEFSDGIINGAKWIKKHYYDEGQNTLYSMIYGKKQYSSSADKWINDISNIITKSYNYILND